MLHTIINKGTNLQQLETEKINIKRWLDKHNIEYDDKDITKALLEKVKQPRPASLYLTN